ncbi:histidine-rich glycoprotein [Orycteropus afer afer]|uniref:Histidine-rich glycoprotein n=1 Tax=Orycteropus afer afer TaxID=1230840 RepID=A0A8B6ZES1_ORYAF|nr:histidine-rich glycoprotein [Orycteropus afer afer]
MKVFLAALLLIALQNSCAVSPTNCDETEPVAGKVLDLINKERQDGYLFQLLRVADAHLDKAESVAVYYLALDVKESDCSVLSRKHWDDCEPVASRRPSDIVIGQCKVVATTPSNELQDLRVNDFNCTTSSVSSALANTKDSPVFLDFFEDTEPYRTLANKALEKYKTENRDFSSFRVDQVERVSRGRGGERTNYYVDFSMRNCSRHHSHRHSNVFGFCRADFSYDVEVSDLETPKDLVVNCDVFNLEEHRSFSGRRYHLGHPFHSSENEHPPAGRPPFKPDRSRYHHHPHKLQESGCPPPLEDKDHPHRGDPPHLPPSGSRCHQCHHPVFGHNQTHGPSHNHNSSKNHPHEHHPHGQHPHGHHPHGHHPHGHHPHKHHHPYKHHPHRKYPHRHHPHHDFQDHGPCDPPPYSQGPQDHHHHDLPPRHSEERGLGKRPLPVHWRQIGYVYRLPPLNKGEVLPLPEANFPRCLLPNQNNPLKPEIQLFPQSASESCPGKFKDEFLHLSKFFEHTTPK